MDYLQVRGTPDAVIADLRGWLSSERAERDLVVETSGSTGTPKRVRISRDAVLASVRASAARLGATGPWVLALPPSYIAGVQVIARSLIAGQEPVILERHGWPTGEGWFVSLVPTQLTRMLASPDDVAALRRAHTVLLGGGPIDASLRTRAADAGIRVVATYGSAETAGGCVYDGRPLDGVRLAIDPDGRIRIGGPTLFTEYVGQPDLTREVLVDGWFRTADAGRIDDGVLSVTGRVDDVIVSGGLNVPGPAVAERLRAHPDVAAAEVLGVPDPEWGNRVVAFVVPKVAGSPDIEEVAPATSPDIEEVAPATSPDIEEVAPATSPDIEEVALATVSRCPEASAVGTTDTVAGSRDGRCATSSTSGADGRCATSSTSGAAPDIEEVALATVSRCPEATSELRDWVAQIHPRTWAPRQIVVLDAIPLLPNGKPDRQALLALVSGDRA